MLPDHFNFPVAILKKVGCRLILYIHVVVSERKQLGVHCV